MNQIITDPALRIKMTGVCNRTCSFCNEEGDMRTIGSVEPDAAFFGCIHTLAKKLGIKKAMLTGGEPTIHPSLYEVVKGIDLPEISITTNGIRPLSIDEWIRLREAGLRRIIVSIHDATPQSLIQLETRQRNFGWAVQALGSQKHNLVAASEAGLRVRVNTVAYHSCDQVNQVLEALRDLQQKYQFDVRLLNDLANIENSQQIIHAVCQSLGAKIIREERRAGSSNATVLWEAESGFRFSTKMAYRYFFDPICTGCPIKEQCYEGFYGIRIERRMSEYWVRLCIYKHSPDVLMPWESFLKSNLAKRFKELCEEEQP
jgi:cyclic pyranopterin phosphate synthase